jgi:hypothetical protein
MTAPRSLLFSSLTHRFLSQNLSDSLRILKITDEPSHHNQNNEGKQAFKSVLSKASVISIPFQPFGISARGPLHAALSAPDSTEKNAYSASLMDASGNLNQHQRSNEVKTVSRPVNSRKRKVYEVNVKTSISKRSKISPSDPTKPSLSVSPLDSNVPESSKLKKPRKPRAKTNSTTIKRPRIQSNSTPLRSNLSLLGNQPIIPGSVKKFAFVSVPASNVLSPLNLKKGLPIQKKSHRPPNSPALPASTTILPRSSKFTSGSNRLSSKDLLFNLMGFREFSLRFDFPVFWPSYWNYFRPDRTLEEEKFQNAEELNELMNSHEKFIQLVEESWSGPIEELLRCLIREIIDDEEFMTNEDEPKVVYWKNLQSWVRKCGSKKSLASNRSKGRIANNGTIKRTKEFIGSAVLWRMCKLAAFGGEKESMDLVEAGDSLEKTSTANSDVNEDEEEEAPVRNLRSKSEKVGNPLIHHVDQKALTLQSKKDKVRVGMCKFQERLVILEEVTNIWLNLKDGRARKSYKEVRPLECYLYPLSDGYVAILGSVWG